MLKNQEKNWKEVQVVQQATAPAQTHFSSGGQDDHSMLSSTGNSKSSTSETANKWNPKNNIVAMKISPSQKYIIIPRKET